MKRPGATGKLREEEMTMEKIYIISGENQAPYGIGEIMEIVPAGHIQKIRKILGQYFFNAPVLRLGGENGPQMELEYDGNKAVGLRRYDR